MIQTQAWSRLNQEPSAEPAGHSKKVWTGKAGVLVTKKVRMGGVRMKMRKSNFRDDLFFQPAGILSSVSAKWSDDCQAKWGD